MSQPAEQNNADKEFGLAIKALQEAAWRLRLAYDAVDRVCGGLPTDACNEYDEYELGAVLATTDLLVVQMDAIAAQTRKLRKRAREI